MRVSFITLLSAALLLVVGACGKTTIEELKSPCVSADTGVSGVKNPCGPKRRPNDNWLHS